MDFFSFPNVSKLTTHFHLITEFKSEWSSSSTQPPAFTACTGEKLPLIVFADKHKPKGKFDSSDRKREKKRRVLLLDDAIC
jgi:hypothetical protein